ncbi:MAG: hypothetical protein IKE10_01590 [Bacilli bacterium]|nr:hypothetical protein [Bacilli bacterium]
MKKIFKSLIFILILTLFVTGCGSTIKEAKCESSAESIALNYLKTKYNIDANVISTNVKMKNQSTFWDGTHIGGEPSGEVTVYTEYDGKYIDVKVNCYDNTVLEDDLYSDFSLDDYSNCYMLDGIYFCDKVSRNLTPNIEVTSINYNGMNLDYEIERNNSRQLLGTYQLEHTSNSSSYLIIFIPAYKLNTDMLSNTRILMDKYYEISGKSEIDEIQLDLTKDNNYYAGYYQFGSGVTTTTFTVIK